jgi:hypothetical protein
MEDAALVSFFSPSHKSRHPERSAAKSKDPRLFRQSQVKRQLVKDVM